MFPKKIALHHHDDHDHDQGLAPNPSNFSPSAEAAPRLRKCARAGQVKYSLLTNGKVKKVTKYLNLIDECCDPASEVEDECTNAADNSDHHRPHPTSPSPPAAHTSRFPKDRAVAAAATAASCSHPSSHSQLSTQSKKAELKQVYTQCHRAMKTAVNG